MCFLVKFIFQKSSVGLHITIRQVNQAYNRKGYRGLHRPAVGRRSIILGNGPYRPTQRYQISQHKNCRRIIYNNRNKQDYWLQIIGHAITRHRTCWLLVTEDRNLIDLYFFKHFKCAGVKCLQNEHFSSLFTKFDHFSQHKKVASFRFEFFYFSHGPSNNPNRQTRQTNRQIEKTDRHADRQMAVALN